MSNTSCFEGNKFIAQEADNLIFSIHPVDYNLYLYFSVSEKDWKMDQKKAMLKKQR